MGATSFGLRDLRFTFALPDGRSFQPGGNFDVLTVQGLAAEVVIENIVSDGILPYSAAVMIQGLTPNHINALTTVGKEYGFSAPTKAPFMSIAAGTLNGQYTTIYNGPLYRSTFVGHQPDVGLQLLSRWASMLQMVPITPTSFNGSVPAAEVLQAIANKIQPPYGPLQIENHGVTAVLSYPYFAGDARAQIQGVARAANCYVAVRGTNIISIYPSPDGALQQPKSKSIPIISAATGLIGYPEFDGLYISVRTVFDPTALLEVGSLFQVQSQLASGIPLQAAQGIWAARSISYRLSCQIPQGPWEAVITGYPPDGLKGTPQYAGMLNWSALP